MNKKQTKEYKKKYRENNKEKTKEYNRKYSENNKESIKENKKKYRKNNKKQTKEYNKKYRENNKEQIKENNRKFKAWCIDYKGSKCSVCGYVKCFAALDFHHIGEKLFSIPTAICKDKKIIKKELDKCILICSNCHRELHYNN